MPKIRRRSQSVADVVEALAHFGIPQRQIAVKVGLSVPTLEKLYARELELGAAEANLRVAQTLHEKAVAGDTTACIFWCKTRLGWREVQKMDLTSSDGSMTPRGLVVDPALFTPEQIRALRGLDEGEKS